MSSSMEFAHSVRVLIASCGVLGSCVRIARGSWRLLGVRVAEMVCLVVVLGALLMVS